MRVKTILLLFSIASSIVPECMAATGNRSRSTRQLSFGAEGQDIHHRRARGGRGDSYATKDKEPGKKMREYSVAKDERLGKSGHHPKEVQPIGLDEKFQSVDMIVTTQTPGNKPEKKEGKKSSRGGRDKAADDAKMEHKKDVSRKPGPPSGNDRGDRGGGPKKGNSYDKKGSVYYTPLPSPIVASPGVSQVQSGTIVYNGVTQSTMTTSSPAPNALSCSQEMCSSQPSSMTLFFTGNSCAASRNFQTNNVFRYYIDSIIQAPTVYVYVTDEVNGGNVYFSGRVNLGENVLIDNGSLLPPSLMVTVYDINVTTELQQFRLQSNCMSGRLYIGDTFCGTMVRSVTTPIQGTFGTCTAVYIQPGQSQPGNSKSGKAGHGYTKSGKSGGNYVPVATVPAVPVVSMVSVPAVPIAPILPTPIQAVLPGECDDPAIMLRMQLTGGGCEASKTLNNQGSDFVCLVDMNESMQSVRVQITAPGNVMIFNSVVAYQDVIEITYPAVVPDMLTVHTVTLDGMKDLQVFSFNPSCKKPLAVGDVLGAFTIVGFETPQQGLVTGGMNNPAMLPPTAPISPPPPTPPPVFMPTQPPAQACKGSQCVAMPTRIKLLFTGSACKSGSNSQGSAYTCTENGMPITFPAQMRIMENNVIIFDGQIPTKDTPLIVGSGVSAIPVDMTVMVMDLAQNTLQTVTFKTDCITPLFIGDEFGALKLVEFTNSEGTAGGCMN